MITATTTLYLYVETPLHAGVGSGLSSIDLPIQRERITHYPMIQGSGIKGKLRSVAEDLVERGIGPLTREKIGIIFGLDKAETPDQMHAGALIAGDARILLFPVRSLTGVFAYITSYDVLNRFMRDLNRDRSISPWKLPVEPQTEQTAQVTQRQKSRVSANRAVVLEEFSFTAEENPLVDEIATWIAAHALPQTSEYTYWREKIQDSLVILPEDDFRDFVVNATEIITRIKIDRKTKTASGTALWTEEHLPTDTLLYVPIYATDSRKPKDQERGEAVVFASEILQDATSLEDHQGGYIQLGGDETVGRGLVRLHWERK